MKQISKVRKAVCAMANHPMPQMQLILYWAILSRRTTNLSFPIFSNR